MKTTFTPNSKTKLGMHLAGTHYVLPRTPEHKVGAQASTEGGQEFETYTASKKAAKSGTVIIRGADGKVISVR